VGLTDSFLVAMPFVMILSIGIASVLGGNFWDKIRALFIYSDRA